MSKYIETFTEEELASEVWRWIPSAPGYAASSLGRIGSCLKLLGGNGRKAVLTGTIQRILSQNIFINPNDGHRHLRLKISVEGKRKTVLVSRLVAEAFLGPRPSGMEVMHGPFDGTQENSLNDRPENLRYGTHSENMRMSIAHVQYNINRRYFSDDQIRQIRDMVKQGISSQKIADQFHVSESSIQAIREGRTYANVV